MDVVVAAAGAGWETEVIAEIEADPRMRLVRRCVDASDLLAVIGTGLASVAFLDPQLGGLDVDAVARLRADGMTVVAVGADGSRLGITVNAVVGNLYDAARDGEGEARADVVPTPVNRATPGRVIAVWGPAGAPGRSTVAVELTAAMAAAGRRCVVVDADTYGGAVAQMLAVVDEVSGLMAACRQANAGNADAVWEHVVNVGGFDLLSGLPRPDMWEHVRSSALELVISRLAGWYEYVVIDTGFGVEPGRDGGASGRDQATLTVLDIADEVVVVGRADPVGVSRLVRAIDGAAQLWRSEPIVVLNRLRDSSGWDGSSVADFVQQTTGIRPLCALRCDGSTVDRAVMSGRTIHEVAPSSALAKQFAQIAARALAQ